MSHARGLCQLCGKGPLVCCCEDTWQDDDPPVKLVNKPILRVPRHKAELDAANARIAALESALAKAEEALEEAYQPEGSHFVGDGCACVGCKYRRSRAALAAIKEARDED